jgi:hypothetical protein
VQAQLRWEKCFNKKHKTGLLLEFEEIKPYKTGAAWLDSSGLALLHDIALIGYSEKKIARIWTFRRWFSLRKPNDWKAMFIIQKESSERTRFWLMINPKLKKQIPYHKSENLTSQRKNENE